MLIRIDQTAAEPLYEQVASSVRRAIAVGEAAPGERLPVARDLAASLDLNVHTVLRGYQLLRDEGLIELRRGRGAVVTADASGRGRLQEALRDLVAEARRIGMGATELTALVTKEMH
ncbi:GntR family transcriptional regulator [Rhodococcus maanshanensis]|uniref:DNA-binding transcriptional regulator YhcF, GntR family n=1 Tax=Rhodococcus maanshanensis TaxID=183556 RepID=A0A1H7VGC8_9NOCA|nr:GntR family transcriptional regulator [Rhodococcus maanshanensis]SEM08342.1 DNA-binding transcriptional regulator YhcF, GntR family [Rhodococcus maanshanensis]